MTAAEGDDPHVLPIEDHLDLHPFQPRDIPDVVHEYLTEAAARGFDEVRLIHGKGIGFQRDRVREVLASHPLVESYADAPAERGHWGATIVRLRAGWQPDRPMDPELPAPET
jgi:dsDNA-specific endonuclease/ATPase MutS2